MGTDRVEPTLFPKYSTLVSAERDLEEYPPFELKARQRGSKARPFEKVVDGEGGMPEDGGLAFSLYELRKGDVRRLGPHVRSVFMAECSVRRGWDKRA